LLLLNYFDWLVYNESDSIYSNCTPNYSSYNHLKWQEKVEKVEKLKQLHQRQSLNHPEQAYSSPSEELVDFSDTPTTLKELVLVHLFISLQFWNIWLLKF